MLNGPGTFAPGRSEAQLPIRQRGSSHDHNSSGWTESCVLERKRSPGRAEPERDSRPRGPGQYACTSTAQTLGGAVWYVVLFTDVRLGRTLELEVEVEVVVSATFHPPCDVRSKWGGSRKEE